MLRVLPEIVELAVIGLAQRDAILDIERLQKRGARFGVIGIGFEDALAFGILVLHPGELLVAPDVGEPVVRIVVGNIGSEGRRREPRESQTESDFTHTCSSTTRLSLPQKSPQKEGG